VKFLELMERAKGRGIEMIEMRGGNAEIAGVCEDSRRVKAGDLFIARGGTRTDGAKYIGDALGRGAVAIVAEDDAQSSVLSTQHSFARVMDANLAAAILAHEVAGNPTGGMKMIGVTGTKGKTTVAYLLRSMLRAAGHNVGMIGTVEIDDGKTAAPAEMTTPGTVELVEMFCRMRANGVTHCVMEVSSHALHQKRVAGIDFAVGIFTNLTGDHLDYHKTMEEYAAAKALLFAGLSEDAVAVINVDDAWSRQMMEPCRGRVVRCCVVERDSPVLGEGIASGWVGAIMTMSSGGMELQVRGPWWSKTRNRAETGMLGVNTALVGRHNVYNLLSVIAGASACGVDFATVVEAIEKDRGVPGRLQAVVGPGRARDEMPFQVFVDYAHTHDALENVLRALRATMGGEVVTRERTIGMPSEAGASYTNAGGSLRLAGHGTRAQARGRLICVFGCGGDRDRTKRPKMGAVAEKLADLVVVTSDNPRTEKPEGILEEICAGFSAGWKNSGKISVEPDRRAAIGMVIGTAESGDVVLIAGKGHENYQIIGTTKHHFDDVEEAEGALAARFGNSRSQ